MYNVIGYAYQSGEKRKIYYGEFNEYSDAHDYKEFLEDSSNWNVNNLPTKPYMFEVEEEQ